MLRLNITIVDDNINHRKTYNNILYSMINIDLHGFILFQSDLYRFVLLYNV